MAVLLVTLLTKSPSSILCEAHSVNVAVSHISDSKNQISDNRCLCLSLASTKPQHFLLSQEMPTPLTHLHSLEWQTPRSCQRRQAWSILKILRTKDLGGVVTAGWGHREYVLQPAHSPRPTGSHERGHPRISTETFPGGCAYRGSQLPVADDCGMGDIAATQYKGPRRRNREGSLV